MAVGIYMGIERARAPNYFRKRAEALRIKASECKDQQLAVSLRNVANTYEQMAQRAALARAATASAQ
jgi:hypothetical protein